MVTSLISKERVLELNEIMRTAYDTSDVALFNAAQKELFEGIGLQIAKDGEPSFPYTSSVTQEKSLQLRSTTLEELDAMFENARESQKYWGQVPLKFHQKLFQYVGEELKEFAEHFKTAISADMGKSVQSSATELVKALEWAKWAQSESVRNALFTVTDRTTGKPIDIDEPFSRNTPVDIETRKPKGVVSSMTSANYPLGLFLGPIVTALVTGSTFVYKAGEKTPTAAVLMKEVIGRAMEKLRKDMVQDTGTRKIFDGILSDDDKFSKFVDGLFSVVQGREEGVAQKLVKDANEFIFIGSEGAGKYFHGLAKEVGKGESTILELGGIAPGIIMNSAYEVKPVEQIAAECYKAQTDNSGQRCTRLTALIVQKGEEGDKLISTLQGKYANEQSHGNSFDPSVQYGPMIYGKGVADKEMQEVIDRAIELGAKISGGELVKKNDGFENTCIRRGALIVWPEDKFNDPEVRKLITDTELFCPLTHVVQVDNLEQAIQFSSELKSRLAGSIYTNSAEDVAQLDAAKLFGEFSVNNPPKDLSPTSGHGGSVEKSGRGRLGGIASLLESTESGQSISMQGTNLAKEVIKRETGIEVGLTQ